MTVSLGKLRAVLEEQSAIVTELLALADRERRALVGHDVQALGVLTAEKARLASDLEELDRRRGELVSACARQFGLANAAPADQVSLRQLVEAGLAAGDPGAAGMAEVHERLADDLLQLAALSKENRLLIISVLGLLRQAREFLATLGRDGAREAPRVGDPLTGRRLLDLRI